MADNTIDTLNIQIKSSSQGATQAIDSVIKNLTRLNGALNNYADASSYSKAMNNIQDGLAGIQGAIEKINTDKLNSIAKSINSLSSAAKKLNGAFGNIGLDKTARDAQMVDSQMDKAVKSIMQMYSTSKSVSGEISDLFSKFSKGITWDKGQFSGITDEAMSAYTSMWDTLEKYAKQSAREAADQYSQGIIEYMRGNKIPVHIPIDWSDISGDINDAKSQLATVFGVGGWSFNAPETGDISEFVRQMNDALGMQLPVGSDAEAFEALFQTVSQARESVSRLSIDANELYRNLVSAASGVEQFKNNLNNTSNTVTTTNPFTELSNGLKELQGVNIPDLTSVSDLAANVSKLGGKKATEGISNLPLLVDGLRSLNGLSIPDIPNLEGLANLIATFNRLGGKKGSAASANIQPMISGLRQLSALQGLTFPDGGNILSLANAFSTLGRETTGRAIQNIPQLATAFKQLMQTLSTAPRVSKSVIALAQAMASLASQGAKVGSASRSMSASIKQVNASFEGIMQRSKAISTRILDFGKNLLLSGHHAESTGRRYETLASKIGLLYAKFWMLIRAVKGLNGMIEVASSLTEVQNVVDTTFGNMSDKIEKFSKNAIKDFGMSELSAKQYAAQFQAMGTSMGITGQQVQKAQQYLNTQKTMEGNVVGYNKASKSMADMSINLTKLTGDLASFYDTSQEDIARKLQSGVFGGQSRALRSLGVDLTQATLQEWALNHGMEANFKTMTQAEKTMLRYQFVMESLAKSQGDFARTSGRLCAA